MVEEYAVVLDYLARGKSSSFKSEPLAQVIGVTEFTLLEVVPKENVSLTSGEKIYVGKEERDKIEHIKKRIEFKELTSTSLIELPKAIEAIIKENPEKFLAFYNKSRSITIRRHQLELLPGLGKKHVQNILMERNKKSFDSFKEIAERVKLVPNPINSLVKRVIEEIDGLDVKYYLFVRQPVQKKDFYFKKSME
jgi:putative nucleotide binding protein